MDLVDFVGDVAVVTTILQFLSGILVCKQYVVNKTTGDASALPFLCGLFSGVLWFLYGCTKADNKIILVNIVGFTLMTLYTFTFIYYSIHKSGVMKQFAFVLVQTFFVVWYATHETDPFKLEANLGVSASIVTLLTVAAPMSKLMHVLKVKNTSCLPFPMILMSFLVCALWACYGALQYDFYLWCVNFIGVGIAVMQLSLFVWYPRTPSAPSPLLPKYVVH